jgi:hypothetical protein
VIPYSFCRVKRAPVSYLLIRAVGVPHGASSLLRVFLDFEVGIYKALQPLLQSGHPLLCMSRAVQTTVARFTRKEDVHFGNLGSLAPEHTVQNYVPRFCSMCWF